MKNVFTGRNIVSSFLFAVVFLIAGCSKSDSAGGGAAPTPTPGTPPTLVVNDPEPGWFSDSVLNFPYSVFSGEAGDQITVKANGTVITQNPYTVTVTTAGPVAVTFTATGKGGTSVPKTVIARKYSQDTSRLCQPSTVEKWYWKSGEVHWPNGTVTPEGTINETTKFFVNGSCTLYPPNLPPLTGGHWGLSNGVITMGGLNWNLSFTNDTTFVRSRMNTVNQLLVETFVKR